MANYVFFVNETEQRVHKVKVGFSWVCLFWTWLFAIPLFIRRVYPWAIGIVILQLFFLIIERKFGLFGFDYSVNYSFIESLNGSLDPSSISWQIHNYKSEWCGLITLAISVYLGFRGNEITARYYLKNGYHFAEPDSAMVKIAKVKWHMQI